MKRMLSGLAGGMAMMLAILLVFNPDLEIMQVILVTSIFVSGATIFGIEISK